MTGGFDLSKYYRSSHDKTYYIGILRERGWKVLEPEFEDPEWQTNRFAHGLDDCVIFFLTPTKHSASVTSALARVTPNE